MTSLAMVAARRGAGDAWPRLGQAAMTPPRTASAQPRYIGAVRPASGPRPAPARGRSGRGAAEKPKLAGDVVLLPGPIPGSTARSQCGRAAPDRPGRVSRQAGRADCRLLAKEDHPRRQPELFHAMRLPLRRGVSRRSTRSDELGAAPSARASCTAPRPVAHGADHPPEDALARHSIRPGRAASRDPRETARPDPATSRECVESLCEGRTNASIAAKLVISQPVDDLVLRRCWPSRRVEANGGSRRGREACRRSRTLSGRVARARHPGMP